MYLLKQKNFSPILGYYSKLFGWRQIVRVGISLETKASEEIPEQSCNFYEIKFFLDNLILSFRIKFEN